MNHILAEWPLIPGDESTGDASRLSSSELSLIEMDETFRLDAFESRRLRAEKKTKAHSDYSKTDPNFWNKKKRKNLKDSSKFSSG